MDPWVHQLDIPEVVTECRGGHDIISPGSKYCLDGSISIVSLLVPSFLVAESPYRVEVLEHVFHSIGGQEVCYCTWRVLKSGAEAYRSTFKSAINIGGHLFLKRSKAA